MIRTNSQYNGVNPKKKKITSRNNQEETRTEPFSDAPRSKHSVLK